MQINTYIYYVIDVVVLQIKKKIPIDYKFLAKFLILLKLFFGKNNNYFLEKIIIAIKLKSIFIFEQKIHDLLDWKNYQF